MRKSARVLLNRAAILCSQKSAGSPMRKSVLQEDIPAARLSMRGSALIDLDTKDTKEKKDYRVCIKIKVHEKI